VPYPAHLAVTFQLHMKLFWGVGHCGSSAHTCGQWLPGQWLCPFASVA